MNRFGVLGVLSLTALTVSLDITAAQQIKTPQLPNPSGTFGVGRMSYDWTDESRPDTLSRDRKARRELMVYMWYPIQRGSQKASGTYFPGARQINAAASNHAIRDEFDGTWPFVVSGAVASHAIENAPIAKTPRRFPLVLFSHGDSMSSFEYSSLIEDLVSHGYIVAAVEHTYEAAAVAFSDGRIAVYSEEMSRRSSDSPGSSPEESLRQALAWARERTDVRAADLRFVLNELFQVDKGTTGPSVFVGRLDFGHVAAVGHSYGGGTAARACQLDQRITVCISQDGGVNPDGAFLIYRESRSLTQPFLLLEVFHPEPTDEQLGRMHETREQWNEIILRKEAQLRSCSGGGYRVVLNAPGMSHASFSDNPMFASANNSAAQKAALHNLQLTITVTRGFLDKYLQHKSAPIFDDGTEIPHQPSAEIAVTRFGPR